MIMYPDLDLSFKGFFMAKQLIINQTLNECRAALIENGEILDFLMERSFHHNPENNHVDFPFVGDIYKGKVVRVLPGMQSAFVDIGYEKAAFLYVDDAYIPTIEEQRDMLKSLFQQKARELLDISLLLEDTLFSCPSLNTLVYLEELKVKKNESVLKKY